MSAIPLPYQFCAQTVVSTRFSNSLDLITACDLLYLVIQDTYACYYVPFTSKAFSCDGAFLSRVGGVGWGGGVTFLDHGLEYVDQGWYNYSTNVDRMI